MYSMEEQKKSVNEISDSVGVINNSARRFSDNSKDLISISESIAESAVKLNHAIRFFKL